MDQVTLLGRYVETVGVYCFHFDRERILLAVVESIIVYFSWPN